MREPHACPTILYRTIFYRHILILIPSYFSKHVTLENLGYSLQRQSKDRKTNPHGYFLIETCRNNNLFILNGRAGSDKYIGDFTFRNKSVIDYAIASVDMFCHVSGFKIKETDPLYSDGHAVLSLDLKCKRVIQNARTSPVSEKKTKRWNDKLSETFSCNINITTLNNLLMLPDTKDSINRITSEIASVFEEAANKTFTKTSQYVQTSDGNKPWFGNECKRVRKEYHKAKKKYQHNKNNYNRGKLSRASKHYKKTMNKYINKYKHKNENKLRNIHSANPKKYWTFINSLKSKSKTDLPPINVFYDFSRKATKTKMLMNILIYHIIYC
ncbi:MAG: hypothetical protein ABW185_26850 [Sedimenticola sp.]